MQEAREAAEQTEATFQVTALRLPATALTQLPVLAHTLPFCPSTVLLRM